MWYCNNSLLYWIDIHTSCEEILNPYLHWCQVWNCFTICDLHNSIESSEHCHLSVPSSDWACPLAVTFCDFLWHFSYWLRNVTSSHWAALLHFRMWRLSQRDCNTRLGTHSYLFRFMAGTFTFVLTLLCKQADSMIKGQMEEPLNCLRGGRRSISDADGYEHCVRWARDLKEYICLRFPALFFLW